MKIFINKSVLLNIKILSSRIRREKPHLIQVWRYNAWDACAWGVVTDDPYGNGRGHIEERIAGTGYSYSSSLTEKQKASYFEEAQSAFADCDVKEYERRYSYTYKEYLCPDGGWYSFNEIIKNARKGRLMGGMRIC